MALRPVVLTILLIGGALAVALGPGPAAQVSDPRIQNGEIIDVTFVDHPPLIVPGKRFYIDVTVKNNGSERREFGLYAAIYKAAPDGTCGSANPDDYIHRTSAFVKSVELAAGGETTVFGEREHWVQLVNDQAVKESGEYEMCVRAESYSKGTKDEPVYPWFFDHYPYRQQLRATNAVPVATITSAPSNATPGEEVSFTALASDLDGDAINYTWDFGDGKKAEGATVNHTYNLQGNFTVTVAAFDGFDAGTATHVISVVGPERTNPTPGLHAAFLLGAAAVVALLTQRGRKR